MSQNPAITVLIPAKNAEDTIHVAIEDALLQEGVNLQIIVANDGSTDNTKLVVQEYIKAKHPIKIIDVKQPGGIVAGRNILLESCETEFLAWLDADDGWSRKDKLIRQVNFLKDNKGYALVGDGKVRGVFTSDFKQKWFKYPISNDDIQLRLLFKNSFINSSLVARTSAVKNMAFKPEYEYLEDYVWVMDVAKKFKIKNMFLGGTVHFIHPATLQNEKYKNYGVFKKEAELLYSRFRELKISITIDESFLLSQFSRRNQKLSKEVYQNLIAILKRIKPQLIEKGYEKESVKGFMFDLKLRALRCRCF